MLICVIWQSSTRFATSWWSA